jgi:hypothetical protein
MVRKMPDTAGDTESPIEVMPDTAPDTESPIEVHQVSRPYNTRDNMVLHVALFLSNENDHSAIQSDIESHFHRMKWSTNSQDMKVVLSEMQAEKWVDCIKYGKKIRLYKLTRLGEEAIKTTYDLVGSNCILKSLKVFRNIPPDLSSDSYY